MKNPTYALLLSTCLCGSHSSAAGAPDPGVYVAAEAGRSSYQHLGAREQDPVAGLRLGYQMTPSFAVELTAHSLSLNIDTPFSSASYYPDRHLGVAAVGQAAIGPGVSVFGRLGFGRTTLHSARLGNPERTDGEATLGVGLGWQVSPQVQLNLEAKRLHSAGVNLILAGAQYHF